MSRAASLSSMLSLLLLIGCETVASQPVPLQPPAQFSPAMSLAPLVEATQPAVVNVYVTAVQELHPTRFQQQLGVPSTREVQGQGSGFVISPDGYILTNNHVAGSASAIEVRFHDGVTRPAKVVGTDAASDVALLKIEADGPLPWLRLGDSDAARVGDWVIALGNPLGLGHTVTFGILSGKGRELSDGLQEDFLQTDASINPGNSGGPLVGIDGAVLGMNTAIISGANSVGFAIPASYLKDIVGQLRERGRVSRGYIGAVLRPLSADGARLVGQPGVLLASVQPGGPGAASGLMEGDIVVSINGEATAEPRDLIQAVAGLAPGSEAEVALIRQGKPQTIKVKLGERPAE